MSETGRRFFWGNNLAQAVVSAGRWFRVDPERLAYRVLDKRHGFVKTRRAILIEVDPKAPLLPEGERARVAPAGEGTPAGRSSGERPGAGAEAGAASRPRREGRRNERREQERERWESPDEESELAVGEALRRLLTLAGLDLVARSERSAQRVEITLEGPGTERLERLGVGFLDELEHLLSRAALGLCGKLVRVRVEGAGLRAARDAELAVLANEAATRLASGEDEVVLQPLEPAERRVIHLTLAERGGFETESLGDGFRKRVRIVRSGGAGADQPSE